MSAYPDAATTQDRIRATSAELTALLDAAAAQKIVRLANDRHGLSARLAELDREWDIDRTLQMNGAMLALIGLLLTAVLSPSWFLLVAFSVVVLLLHALQVWCPPLAVLRQLGVRTRREIERERCALRLLRGDFDRAVQSAGRERVEQTIHAVWR